MQRDLVKELILRSLVEGAETVVLCMPRNGQPLIACSISEPPEELLLRIRGWVGLLDRAIQNRDLVDTTKEAHVVQ